MSDFVGDYSLTSIILRKNNIDIEIKELVTELNLYSSINSVAISADMVITDNKNLLQTIPLQGGEEIIIDVGTNSNKYILYFIIYKIDSKVQQEKTQVYIIRLCTIDTIKNEQSRYSLRHKNQFAENIVADLLKNSLKSNKPIDIDKTVYPINFINPNWRIFDTCTWLSRKSVPRQNIESCGFLFYETLKGYNFKSIDNLFSHISQNKNNPFTYSAAKTNTDADKNYRIMKYSSSEKYFDIMEETRMGNVAHYTQRISFTESKMSLSKSSLNSAWKYFSHLGGGQIPIDINNKPLQNPSRVIYTSIVNDLFSSSGSYNSDSDTINKLLDRSIYRYNSMDFYQIDIEIAGNLGIEVGNIYSLLFPSPNSDSDINRNRMADNGLSGYWMAHSLKHTINRTNAITILRLCRDSSGGDATPVKSANTTIDTTIFNIGNNDIA